MTDARVQIVADGYDAIGETFAAWRDRIVGDPRDEWRDELLSRLPDGARVLELGCGAGVPDTALLAARFRLTAVDVSPEQIRRASAAVPDATFVCADFTELELEPGSFEAVAAFYSFNHVPRDLLAPLFARVAGWLVRDGLFLTALGTTDLEDWTGEWLGAPTYFSSFEPETNTRLLEDAGFELLRDELVTFTEPDGDVTFQWILGRT
ncbi:MAG TPA: class I SAM-dependent methyltransferase [Gaiellaceae bacterium]|nr:class I SAM-dependent methyltransferase [Gaiellaceae bacterium]